MQSKSPERLVNSTIMISEFLRFMENIVACSVERVSQARSRDGSVNIASRHHCDFLEASSQNTFPTRLASNLNQVLDLLSYSTSQLFESISNPHLKPTTASDNGHGKLRPVYSHAGLIVAHFRLPEVASHMLRNSR